MLIFYYLVLPVLLGALVIKLIKSSGAWEPPAHIKDLFAAHPIEKRMFRSVRVTGGAGRPVASLIADHETQSDAVDAIYAAKEQAQRAGERASFLVLNDKMETLEQVDS